MPRCVTCDGWQPKAVVKCPLCGTDMPHEAAAVQAATALHRDRVNSCWTRDEHDGPPWRLLLASVAVLALIIGAVAWTGSAVGSVMGAVAAGALALALAAVYVFLAAMGYSDLPEREQTTGLRVLLGLTVVACFALVAAAVMQGLNGKIVAALAGPVGMVAAWLSVIYSGGHGWPSGKFWDWLEPLAIWLSPPLIGLAAAIALGA